MKPKGGARKPTQGKKPIGGDKKPTIEVKKPEMTDGGRRKKPSPTKPDTGGGGIVGNYPSLPKKPTGDGPKKEPDTGNGGKILVYMDPYPDPGPPLDRKPDTGGE